MYLMVCKIKPIEIFSEEFLSNENIDYNFTDDSVDATKAKIVVVWCEGKDHYTCKEDLFKDFVYTSKCYANLMVSQVATCLLKNVINDIIKVETDEKYCHNVKGVTQDVLPEYHVKFGDGFGVKINSIQYNGEITEHAYIFYCNEGNTVENIMSQYGKTKIDFY